MIYKLYKISDNPQLITWIITATLDWLELADWSSHLSLPPIFIGPSTSYIYVQRYIYLHLGGACDCIVLLGLVSNVSCVQ